MTEDVIKQEIRKRLGTRHGVTLFTNPVGNGFMGRSYQEFGYNEYTIIYGARRVAFGLCEGSADLIGWRSLVIRPEHVGKTIAQFVSFEVKTKTGRPTSAQLNFIEQVRLAGGAAAIVRSADEAEEALKNV